LDLPRADLPAVTAASVPIHILTRLDSGFDSELKMLSMLQIPQLGTAA